jgi:hypothetical protein
MHFCLCASSRLCNRALLANYFHYVPLHPAPSEPLIRHLQVEEDFEADLALIGDDPLKPIDLSALKAKPKTDVPPSQPTEAGGAESTTAQPAAEQSPGPS